MLADLAATRFPPVWPGLGEVRVRPPQRADLPRIDDLLHAVASARGRPPALRRADLELRWLQLGDPREAVVVLGHDDLHHDDVLAYAAATPEIDLHDDHLTVHLDLLVHPSCTGRGLGSHLLDLATDTGRTAAALPPASAASPTAPSVRIRTALTDGSPTERAWFTDRGFTARRHLLDLHLDLHAAPPAARWPADVRVRSFRPGVDDEVLWEVHQRAFADVPTHLPIARDDLLRDRDPVGDPDLVLLAYHLDASEALGTGADSGPRAGDRNEVVNIAAGRASTEAVNTAIGQAGTEVVNTAIGRAGTEVVGIAIGRAGTEVATSDGWVRDLAVVPEWRRRGIAMALLRESFARFRARGLTGAALEVDDVTLEGAAALYRRAGMRVTRRIDVLERLS